MTAQSTTTSTEAPPPAKQARGVMKGAYSVGLTAFLAWIGGAAARSWHLSVPFLAGWVVLLSAALLTEHLTSIVAWAWHREKIEATPQLVTFTKTAELTAEVLAKKFLVSKGVDL